MNKKDLYEILRTISIEKSLHDDAFKRLPENPDWGSALEDLGIDLISAQELFPALENRVPTKAFKIPLSLLEQLQSFSSLGNLFDYLIEKGFERHVDREVVYVDDEPENLFVFNRKFGKRVKLKTFDKPLEALEYILKTPTVGLVITDEVMPLMNGNLLCDETRKSKPNLKFILLTGNPNNDDDLLYNSLRKDRFYEFIRKPVDFDVKGEEYISMIQGLLEFDW